MVSEIILVLVQGKVKCSEPKLRFYWDCGWPEI